MESVRLLPHHYLQSKRFLQLFLYLLIVLLATSLSGCSSHKKTTKRAEYYKKEKQEVEALSKHLTGDYKKLIQEAEGWIGTPYKYAGQEKGKGTDCSGYVMVVFKEAIGCMLPRNSAKQAEYCKKIKASNVKAGDLVFFGNDRGINHVGIMVNGTNFLHASSSKGVILSSMESNYYQTHFKMFGRVPCL